MASERGREPVEEERLYPRLSEEEKGPFLDDVREHLVWQKVWRERLARERRAAEEEPPAKPEV